MRRGHRSADDVRFPSEIHWGEPVDPSEFRHGIHELLRDLNAYAIASPRDVDAGWVP